MQGSPPFDGDVEESHELRYTLNSTTTGSPHTDLVSTPDQPSHDNLGREQICSGGSGSDLAGADLAGADLAGVVFLFR